MPTTSYADEPSSTSDGLPRVFYRSVMSSPERRGSAVIWSAAPTRSPATPASSATPRTSTSSCVARLRARAGGARSAGCHTELTFPHWLGKAMCGDDFVDVIFSSGNGSRSRRRLVRRTRSTARCSACRCMLSPAEEMIWSKAFIMERERFDGADVHHILRARAARSTGRACCAASARTGACCSPTWCCSASSTRATRSGIPAWVIEQLITALTRRRARRRRTSTLCYGTLLSRAQYLIDIDKWGYEDARLVPRRS